MRISFISLTFLSAFFACVAASPVVVHGTPQSGSILSERALQRTHKGASQPKKQSPQKVAVKQSGAACAIRPSTKRPRDLEFALLDRRGDLNDKELRYYNIDTQKSNGGSYGDIFNIIGYPNLLAKASNVKPGVGPQQSVEEFKQEARHLQAVGQFVDWGYKLNGCGQKVYFIIMRKVNGTPFHRTSTYAATRGDPVGRRALVDHVAGLVAQKMVQHHVASRGVLHVDPNASNIMCIENHGHIVSVDLVDWGNAGYAQNVDYHVALDIARHALEPMYRMY